MTYITKTHNYYIISIIEMAIEIKQLNKQQSLRSIIESGNFYQYSNDMEWLSFRTIIQDNVTENHIEIEDIEI